MLSGVGDLYTDPQVHSTNLNEYGDANLGTKGMALFFSSHRCNKWVHCRFLEFSHCNTIDWLTVSGTVVNESIVYVWTELNVFGVQTMKTVSVARYPVFPSRYSSCIILRFKCIWKDTFYCTMCRNFKNCNTSSVILFVRVRCWWDISVWFMLSSMREKMALLARTKLTTSCQLCLLNSWVTQFMTDFVRWDALSLTA